MTPWGPPQTAWHSCTPQAVSHGAAPYNWFQGAAATAAPVTPNIALTISEMLTQPQVFDDHMITSAHGFESSARGLVQQSIVAGLLLLWSAFGKPP